jgi:putative peptide zinc metalloprotease protein
MPSLPKLRSDLISSPSQVDGATVYTVKDPVGGNYFRLREPEHWLIHQFDGRSTPDQIAERFRNKFQLNITADNVSQFVEVMDKLLFLENSRSEQAIGRTSQTVGAKRSLFGRLLFVKIKAFAPGRFLDLLTRLYRPFHRPFWFAVQALVILIGLAILFTHRSSFAITLSELWNLESIGLVIFSLFLLVTLHELAHAVACRVLGGEVREIGFLLLYFQPCFYCDLSDAWLFEKKSQRLAVTWAGPYFQLLLLALSLILWRVTVPGIGLNHWAWILVTVNWINLLFNFNPLIKLDGYYLLSDWVDIPNLRQKAFGYLGNFLQRHLLGWEIGPIDVTPRQRRIFLIYSVTALIYSGWLLGYFFSLFAAFLLDQAGPGGLILFLLALLLILRSSLRKLASGLLTHLRHMRKLLKKPLRLIGYLAVIAVVLVVGLTVPLPQRVSGDVLVRPIAEFRVQLNQYGLLEKITRYGGAEPDHSTDILQLASTDMSALNVVPLVDDGQLVRKGDTIALVSSNQITREIETGRAELARLEGELALLKAPPKAEEIDEARAQVVAAEANLRQLERERDRTKTLVDGDLEAAERLEASQAEVEIAEAELEKRRSTVRLLEAPPRPEEETVILREIDKQRAQLVFLEEQADATHIVTPISGRARINANDGSVISIATANVVEILVPVSDFDIPLVQLGQEVSVKVRSYPDRTFEGTVVRLPSAGDESGERVTFPVVVVVDNSDGLLRAHMSGYAKIRTGKSTLAGWGFRKLYSSLRVEFWSWW